MQPSLRENKFTQFIFTAKRVISVISNGVHGRLLLQNCLENKLPPKVRPTLGKLNVTHDLVL